jgi:GNAT superfamily N-acetyltransferase
MTIEVYTVSSFIIFDKIIEEEIVSRIESIKIGDELDIISIFTNKEHRGKGYATELFEKVKTYCKNHSLKNIILDDVSGVNPPSNLYYKLGFKINVNSKWVKWNINSSDYDERRLLEVKD